MNWLRFLARQSRATILAIGLILVVVLGLVDYVTGPEISFSIFYLIPTASLAWVSGLTAGVIASIAAASTYLVADLLGPEVYSHPSIPYWNALVRLGFFLIVAVSLSSLRSAQDKRQELRQFVVHDLRSPLSNVMTGLDILREDSDSRLNEQQKGFVDMCMVSCTRMLTLINSLLDLPRLERGRMPLKREPVAADQLVVVALAQVRLWAQQKDVHMDVETPSDHVVEADAEITVRVLVNILSNAVKHAPDGSMITIRSTRHDNNHVAFSVRDEGVGVAKEWAKKVFEPYVQTEPEDAAHGSGLGLAFSRRAVRAQGGEIWIESAPAKGATVTFTLPRASHGGR